jgi:hypothetical protein
VAASVHRDDAEMWAQAFGDEVPEGSAEAVGVVQQGQGTAPSPVEQGDLESGIEPDAASLDVLEHGGGF